MLMRWTGVIVLVLLAVVLYLALPGGLDFRPAMRGSSAAPMATAAPTTAAPTTAAPTTAAHKTAVPTTAAPAPAVTSSFDESACTVYVDAQTGNDSNSGRARNQARRTISSATGIAQAGDNVCVYPGQYGAWTNRANGDANARIRYVSIERWAAKVAAPIRNNGEYVDIDGFEVTSNGNSVSDGIVNGGGEFASHSRIFNNHVYGLSAPDCSPCGSGITSAGWKSSAKYEGVDVEIFDNLIHDLTQGHGIYISHPYAKIYRNTVYNIAPGGGGTGNGGWGIHGWHNANYVEVASNYVADSFGIVMGNGDEPCGTITCVQRGYVITNNTLCDNSRGIDLRGSGHTNDGNAFYNTPPSGTNQKVAVCR